MQRKKNRDVMQKFTVFKTDGNIVHHRHFLDSRVFSGQEKRMKNTSLDSSKSGEYADIDIIP